MLPSFHGFHQINFDWYIVAVVIISKEPWFTSKKSISQSMRDALFCCLISLEKFEHIWDILRHSFTSVLPNTLKPVLFIYLFIYYSGNRGRAQYYEE